MNYIHPQTDAMTHQLNEIHERSNYSITRSHKHTLLFVSLSHTSFTPAPSVRLSLKQLSSAKHNEPFLLLDVRKHADYCKDNVLDDSNYMLI